MPPFSPSNISILSSSSSSRPCPSSETSPHSRINHISVPCSSPRAPCSSPQVPSCSGPQVPPCSSPRVPASPSLTRSGSSPLHSSDLSIFSSQSDHSTQEMPALTKVLFIFVFYSITGKEKYQHELFKYHEVKFKLFFLVLFSFIFIVFF